MSNLPPGDHQFGQGPPDHQFGGPADKPPAQQFGNPGKPPGDYHHHPQRTSGMAIASLILGVLTFMFCALTGIPAFICGLLGLSEVKRSRGAVGGSGLAVAGMILAFAGCIVPVLLLLPAINASREAARRNGCLNNIRHLGLASFNHESTMKRFPLVSSVGVELTSQTPGAGLKDNPATADGYSYAVYLLPYMEERILYDSIRTQTEKLSNEGGAFGHTAANDPVRADGMHFSEQMIPAFRCPSYYADAQCLPDANYAGGAVTPAIGNYVAIVATDLEGADGKLPEHKLVYGSWENGGLGSSCRSGPDCDARGLKINEIGDGTAKTFMLAESCEQRYGSWFSSASTWVVAATGGTDSRESLGEVTSPDHFVELSSGNLALNWGDPRAYKDASTRDIYLAPAKNRWAGDRARVFGASSHHGGIVHHVFFDAHAQSVNVDVDPTVYLRFVTRMDGDPSGEIH